MAVTLLAGSWIAVLHIFVAMVSGNDFDALSAVAAAEMVAHSLVLVLLLVVVSIWYWAVAIYKETPAGMLANPAAEP